MKLFQKLSYASLVFPGAAAGMPIFIFILPYYAGDLGLGLSLVGVLFFLGRITDIFTDPVMGVLIDKYPSKWGKHKHWILISAPILMLATYFIFIPTTANPSAFYFFASLLLLYTGFTLCTITQLSWSSFLAPNYDERTKLLTLRELIALLSMFCVITIPAIVELFNTSLESKVFAIGIFVIICTPIITANALKQVPDSMVTHNRVKAENPFKTFASLFANKMLNKIVIAAVIIGFCTGLNGALYLIWMEVVVELPEYSSRLMLAYYVVSVLGLWVWRELSIRTSKHFSAGTACIYAIVILAIGYIGYGFIKEMDTSGRLLAVTTFIILYGFAFSGPLPLINAIIADISDKLTLEQNESISGTVFAYLTTLTKIGFALAAAVPYLILEMVWGFDISLRTSNTEVSKMGIFYLYTFIPIIGYALAAYLLFTHTFGRQEHADIQSNLRDK
ncbi:MAG: MFS transporter [Proteobacteria bacterium]|nr:MFS transporter [Pseudomonadota bacterium]